MMPDTYGSALVLIGAGLHGFVVLCSLVALARAIMSRKPHVVYIIEDQLPEGEGGTGAQAASESVSRALVLVEHVPQARYTVLSIIHAATTERGPEALAAIAESNDLVVLHDFCRRN